jgi:hypothetical protein
MNTTEPKIGEMVWAWDNDEPDSFAYARYEGPTKFKSSAYPYNTSIGVFDRISTTMPEHIKEILSKCT